MTSELRNIAPSRFGESEQTDGKTTRLDRTARDDRVDASSHVEAAKSYLVYPLALPVRADPHRRYGAWPGRARCD